MRGHTLPLILMALLSGSAVCAEDTIRRVPARPAYADSAAAADDETASKANRGCVPVDAIAGAVVTDDRTVELSLKDGSRWRMRLADACPALGYYQGFYYRRAQAKYLCARHDAVIARSGGECPIASLSRIKKPRRTQ